MGGLTVTIDVRDMLCAQALALTDRAMRGLGPDGTLAVRCNTPDVVQDLLTWASDQGHVVNSETVHDGETRLVLAHTRR